MVDAEGALAAVLHVVLQRDGHGREGQLHAHMTLLKAGRSW